MERRFSPFFAKYFLRIGSCSARVAKRHPPAVCSSMNPPRLASSARLISSSCSITASLPSPANASASSSSFTGSLLTKRMASRAARNPVGSRDQDLAEILALLQRDAAEPHQLQRAEEDRDQLVAVASFEKPLQTDRRFFLKLLVQLAHLVADLVNRSAQLDRLRVILLVAIERGSEGIDQIEQADFAHIDLAGVDTRQRRCRPRPDSHPKDVELRERLGHGLEA